VRDVFVEKRLKHVYLAFQLPVTFLGLQRARSALSTAVESNITSLDTCELALAFSGSVTVIEALFKV
jgi:hypothetical protein